MEKTLILTFDLNYYGLQKKHATDGRCKMLIQMIHITRLYVPSSTYLRQRLKSLLNFNFSNVEQLRSIICIDLQEERNTLSQSLTLFSTNPLHLILYTELFKSVFLLWVNLSRLFSGSVRREQWIHEVQ